MSSSMACAISIRSNGSLVWTGECSGRLPVRKTDRQADKAVSRENACKIGGDLPGRGGADEDRVAGVGDRDTGRHQERGVSRDPPEEGVRVEQQVQRLLLPRDEFIVRQGVEKLGADRHDATQRAELALGDRARAWRWAPYTNGP